MVLCPEDGLLVRLRVDGQRLSASFEGEAAGQPGNSLMIIRQALERLTIDQILNPDDPFAAYHPGKFGYVGGHAEPAEEESPVEQAST